MIRRLFLSAISSMFWLAILAAGILGHRLELAEIAVSSRLQSLGLSRVRFSITALDLNHLTAEGLAFGDGEVVVADRVTQSYTPFDLLAGELGETVIAGLRLRLDLTGADGPLGNLKPLLEGGPAADGAALKPAAVILKSGRIEAMVQAGLIAASVNGNWQPGDDRGAELSLTDFEVPGVNLDTARMDVVATSNRIVAKAAIHDRDGAVAIDMNSIIDAYQVNPIVDLTFDARIKPGIWQNLPPESSGAAVLIGRIEGQIGPATMADEETAPIDRLLGSNLKGNVRATLENITHGDRVQGISGNLALDLKLADGELNAVLIEGAVLDIARIDPAIYDEIGIPTLATEWAGASLSLKATRSETPLAVHMRRTDGGANLDISGGARLTIGGSALALNGDGSVGIDDNLTITQISLPRAEMGLRNFPFGENYLERLDITGSVGGKPGAMAGTATLSAGLREPRIAFLGSPDGSLDASVDIDWSDDLVSVRQRGEGIAMFAGLRIGNLARYPGKLAVTLVDGEMTLSGRPDGLAMTHAVNITPRAATLLINRARSRSLAIWADPGVLRLEGSQAAAGPYQATLALKRGYFVLPGEDLSADSVSASITFPQVEGEPLGTVTIRRLRHTAKPADFPPFRIDGSIRQRKGRYEINAAGVAARGALRFIARGRHQPANGRGSLRIRIPETILGADAIEPAELFPRFPALQGLSGSASATAEIGWRPGRLSTTGAVNLNDLSFILDGTRFQGLNTQIVLAGLQPVSTEPGQLITVRRIDPALPLDDVAIRFQAEPPLIQIETASARFAGGRLTMTGADLDASRRRQDMTVGVEGVELGTLLDFLKVEDVSGTGRLSGSLPLLITDGRIALANGQLAAEGPGVLNMRSEAAAALGGGGEQVELVLRALEDFRYDTLAATLDSSRDGQAAFRINLQGHNPAVLDGYPFAFNIDLGGNLAKLLGVVRQGAQLSTDLIKSQIR